MNDTHGVAGKGWHGFDLDGTLAVYDKWEGIDHIGEPVAPMVDLITKMHEDGEVVKIVTARVSPRKVPDVKDNPYRNLPIPDYAKIDNAGVGLAVSLGAMYAQDTWTAREFIIDWCLKYLSFIPEITHEKDHLMLDLYDDRVKQVVPNKGLLVEELGPKLEVHPIAVRREHLDVFDQAAMAIGKVFIWSSVAWGIIWVIPMVVEKLVK